MKKLYFLLLACIINGSVFAQQQILLMTESFENGPGGFDFSTGGVGSNTGNNAWIVNDEYNGAPLYPLTPPQDSIVSGTINGAPNSNYLHIHDQAAFVSNSIANCNWNTSTASDRFTFIGNSFCTLGMSNVIFTFFWIGEGVPGTSYGEVYYRIDGGAWIKTGLAEYSGQNKWKYEVIQDPAFDNVQNLQMGFRWVNTAAGGNNTISFGIDDIIAVGTFNANPNDPVTVNVTLVTPTTVCQDNFLTIGYELSQPLCDGTYQIEMSDAAGSFATPINGGVFNIGAPDTTGFIGFQVPNNVAGNCFKVRINRLSPAPQVTGTASVCFIIQDCPESIITNNAPVMNDMDTTCLMSVIDVKFNSFGVFGPGMATNVYTAQLSDSTGSFGAPFTLGTLPSDEAFPGQPGNVSGLIPANVPPGCGYYIRVVSSIPSVVGTVIGPFCLVKCDELTNNHTDLHFCIPQGVNADGLCKTLQIHPNQWNTQANYDTCNNWTIELRSMMTFGLVNSGGLGVYHDSVGGNFTLCVPGVRDSLPVPPGAYYMRIVSNCSDQPWNQTGSVIRVTIGAPDTIPPDILMDDTVECNFTLVSLEVNPFNHPPSDYEWASNILNNGNPFIWPYNPLLIDFSTNPPTAGDYIFYVREKNFGCYGPYSSAGKLTLITKPVPVISGPDHVCLGDTVTFNVQYMPETYYNWDAPAGVTILDEANSQTTVIFDSVGIFTLNNFSLNNCGGDSGVSAPIRVFTPFDVNVGPDKQGCIGDSVTLHATSGDQDKVLTTSDTAHAQYGRPGGMFNIIAHGDVIIDSFAVKYSTAVPLSVNAEIWSRHGSYKSYEQQGFMWNNAGGYNGISPSPLGQFTVIPYFINQPIATNDTFGFYLTTSNQAPVINEAFRPSSGPTGTVFMSDGIIDFVQGTANNYSFGAFSARVLEVRIYYSTKAGLHYLWNTGDTSATVTFPATTNGQYSIQVYDTSGCQNRDTLFVTVHPKPTVEAGADTLICGPNGTYTLNGSASVPDIVWSPSNGLSSTTILNPQWNNTQPQRYYLTATDPLGCANVDSVFINTVTVTADAGTAVTICNGDSLSLAATSSVPGIEWQPATGLSDVHSLTPAFSHNESITYTLIATDTSGCAASDTVSITVNPCNDSYLKVPSAFAPNGNGQNDYFTVFGKNIATYEIRIYNRWGQVVYNSNDPSELNDLSRGWDGKYKGALQELGTFVYYITAHDIAGRELTKKGNLTLIR